MDDVGTQQGQIELFLNCLNLVLNEECSINSFAVLSQSNGGNDNFEEIGRSETICNSNSPQYCTSFQLSYNLNELGTTFLRICIYRRKTEQTERLKDHKSIGGVTFSFEELLSAPGNQLSLPLRNQYGNYGNGALHINAEEVDTSNPEINSEIQIDISAAILRKKDWNKTLLSQRFELRRAHKHDDSEGRTVWLPVYRSDRIAKQRDSNTLIEFSSACFKHRHLCNGDDQRRIRILIFTTPHQHSKRTSPEIFIGMADFTLRDLCEIDPTTEVFELEKDIEDEDIGNLSILKAEPTDFGSHFALRINHESTEKYSSTQNEDKRPHLLKKKSMARRLSIARREKGKPPSMVLEFSSPVQDLFRNPSG